MRRYQSHFRFSYEGLAFQGGLPGSGPPSESTAKDVEVQAVFPDPMKATAASS